MFVNNEIANMIERYSTGIPPLEPQRVKALPSHLHNHPSPPLIFMRPCKHMINFVVVHGPYLERVEDLNLPMSNKTQPFPRQEEAS